MPTTRSQTGKLPVPKTPSTPPKKTRKQHTRTNSQSSTSKEPSEFSQFCLKLEANVNAKLEAQQRELDQLKESIEALRDVIQERKRPRQEAEYQPSERSDTSDEELDGHDDDDEGFDNPDSDYYVIPKAYKKRKNSPTIADENEESDDDSVIIITQEEEEQYEVGEFVTIQSRDQSKQFYAVISAKNGRRVMLQWFYTLEDANIMPLFEEVLTGPENELFLSGSQQWDDCDNITGRFELELRFQSDGLFTVVTNALGPRVPSSSSKVPRMRCACYYKEPEEIHKKYGGFEPVTWDHFKFAGSFLISHRVVKATLLAKCGAFDVDRYRLFELQSKNPTASDDEFFVVPDDYYDSDKQSESDDEDSIGEESDTEEFELSQELQQVLALPMFSGSGMDYEKNLVLDYLRGKLTEKEYTEKCKTLTLELLDTKCITKNDIREQLENHIEILHVSTRPCRQNSSVCVACGTTFKHSFLRRNELLLDYSKHNSSGFGALKHYPLSPGCFSRFKNAANLIQLLLGIKDWIHNKKNATEETLDKFFQQLRHAVLELKKNRQYNNPNYQYFEEKPWELTVE